MILEPRDYARWLGLARRVSHRHGEAEDLLQEALLVAVSTGRPPGVSENSAWFAGVLRNLAKSRARSAVRRKNREKTAVPPEAAHDPVPPIEVADDRERWFHSIRSLPVAQRAVIVLALNGMNRREIASALAISDAALRQRLTALRKRPELLEFPPTASQRPYAVALELGALRRTLRQLLQSRGRIGTHDPDGHLLLISTNRTHKPAKLGNSKTDRGQSAQKEKP